MYRYTYLFKTNICQPTIGPILKYKNIWIVVVDDFFFYTPLHALFFSIKKSQKSLSFDLCFEQQLLWLIDNYKQMRG